MAVGQSEGVSFSFHGETEGIIYWQRSCIKNSAEEKKKKKELCRYKDSSLQADTCLQNWVQLECYYSHFSESC